MQLHELRLDDYKYAGTINIETYSKYNVTPVHCAYCMRMVFYTGKDMHQQYLWTFDQHTGWLCHKCARYHKAGYTMALQYEGQFYHLYCALQHNIIDLFRVNNAVNILRDAQNVSEIIQLQRSISFMKSYHVCDSCQQTLNRYPRR